MIARGLTWAAAVLGACLALYFVYLVSNPENGKSKTGATASHQSKRARRP